MKALSFPDDDTLLLALTSGLVPSEVAGQGASFARHPDGAILVSPEAKLTREVLGQLETAGIPYARTGLKGREVCCWGEMLAPTRTKGADASRLVLFVLPPDACLSLASEMLRLGCDRQDFCFLPDQEVALLRAIDPPYFTLASVLDGSRRARAFTPSPPGQEALWVELGWAHPLRESLKTPNDQLVLVGSDGRWQRLPNGPWRSVYELIEIAVPTRDAKAPIPPPGKIGVSLRLRPGGRDDPASLWVLRSDGIGQLEALVRTVSDELLSRLLFAASGKKDDPTVVLWVRPGRQAPPELVVSGEAYLPFPRLPNLFLPRGFSLEPPLRRDRLQETLVADAESLTWLARGEGEAFRAESLPERAFHPLTDWVEYIVHSRAAALEPWARSALFEFEAFEAREGVWLEKEKEKAPEPKARKARAFKPNPAPVVVAQPVEEVVDEGAEAAEEEEVEKKYALAPSSKLEDDLKEVEKRFVELDAPPDAPARIDLWLEMATLNAALKKWREAGLCWASAFWPTSGAEALRVGRQWTRGELRRLGAAVSAGDAAKRLIASTKPSNDDVRAVAALASLEAVAPGEVPGLTDSLHAAKVWLDNFDDALDARAFWLSHHALARLVGGDRLGLARSRDRLLARLRTGLSLERDVPAFLRWVGQAGGQGHDAARVTKVVEDLLKKFLTTQRKRSAVEAPETFTRAYVLFTFAWGLARLGAGERARALCKEAEPLLKADDGIHRFLAQAYRARVEQALEGLPPESPLPAALQAELNALERFPRYKVDRLRQASSILEPQERLDPIRAFHRAGNDPRGEKLAALRGLTDSDKLTREIDKLLEEASHLHEEAAQALLDGLMDFFPALPETIAVSRLDRVVQLAAPMTPVRRALVLEEALMLAGYFGQAGRVKSTVGDLMAILAELQPADALEVGTSLGRCLRSLRRVGLKQEAANLLEAVVRSVKGHETRAVEVRLQVAAGLAFLGDSMRAAPLLEAGEAALAKATVISEKLSVARALASALGETSLDDAVKGMMRLVEQLPTLTDSFNTNSHFCLAVIHFAESVVMGLASPDLALGDFGRRWLDEEEQVVRARVHRDWALM